jgi:hypothetical protein
LNIVFAHQSEEHLFVRSHGGLTILIIYSFLCAEIWAGSPALARLLLILGLPYRGLCAIIFIVFNRTISVRR